MPRTLIIACWTAVALVPSLADFSCFGDSPFLVIAHRGASGYLPEHTLEAVSLAYGMGADFIEQDVVLTKDAQPVVLHDIHLDTVTDVAVRFSGRQRADGRFYAIDFTLEEIKQLCVHERVDHQTDKPVFTQRFPRQSHARFEVPTLAEELELIQSLNRSTGANVGIYPEIKQPAWHRAQGFDISSVVLETLREYGYSQRTHACFLQCFEVAELQRIRRDLASQLSLIQLLTREQGVLLSETGLGNVAAYAQGIGPEISMLVSSDSTSSSLLLDRTIIAQAHAAGLVIHPYTFRADQLPPGASDMRSLVTIFANAGVDGGFTDFPDQARGVMRSDGRSSAP